MKKNGIKYLDNASTRLLIGKYAKSISTDKRGNSCTKRLMTNQRIPQEIAQAILGISDNYWIVLIAINVFFLLAGTIIHGTPAILMLVPIFLPLADQLGIDRVHFGLILTINLGIGQQTPPVASVVLITCAIAKISIAKIIPSMLWFIGAMLVALVLINIFPALSLWLPSIIL